MEDLSFFKVLDETRFPYRRGKKEANIGRIAFTMMFFLAPSDDPSTPDRLADAEGALRDLVPLSVYRWWVDDADGKVQSIDKANPPTFARLVGTDPDVALRKRGFLQLWNSEPIWDGDAPTHLLNAAWLSELDHPSWLKRDSVSYAHSFQLTISLPWIEAQDRPGLLQWLFADLCTRLRPTHAVGGLHLSTAIEPVWMQEGRETLYPFLRRFPGLMVGHAFQIACSARFRMGTVNWLNAVSEPLLDLCGGRAAVLAGLSDPAFVVGDMPGGIIVQAGPSPQLGDREAGLRIAPYGALARTLKPARLEIVNNAAATEDYAMPGSLYDPDLRAASQREWVMRFDDH